MEKKPAYNQEWLDMEMKRRLTVQVLPDQPLPAGTQQNAMFTPAAFHLRDLFWIEREALIGKIVDFEYLSGATKGRMGRIFRLREDIVPGTSLGL